MSYTYVNLNKRDVSPMKILIIDDDEIIHSMITDRLSIEGYEIFSAYNGTDGIEEIKKNHFDMILLDIRMPRMSGFDFIKVLREADPDIPVIMLSSINEEETKITAFQSGADDYMCKPIATGELAARIKTIFKRQIPALREIRGIHIGNGFFDFQKKLFIVKDSIEECSKYEILILKLLASCKGKIFTRDDILHYAWGADKFPTNRTIDNYIVRLREKIGKCYYEAPTTDVIESVYGSGYRLNLP